MIVRPPDWSPEGEPGIEWGESDIEKLAEELVKYHALFEECNTLICLYLKWKFLDLSSNQMYRG